MPAGTTALTVLTPPSTPAGPTWDEQASDQTNGNSFDNNAGDVFLYVRNTTAGALDGLGSSSSAGSYSESAGSWSSYSCWVVVGVGAGVGESPHWPVVAASDEDPAGHKQSVHCAAPPAAELPAPQSLQD